jgi:hypothetical protein
MADETGIRTTGDQHIHFDKLLAQNSNILKLIKSGISSKHYSLYMEGTTKFYVTDDKNNYVGHIFFSNEHSMIKIQDSFSKLKEGFYQLMFTSILALTNINEILSDNQLSTNAINAYERLSNKHSGLDIKILTYDGYKPFDRKLLVSNPNYRVSVTDNKILEFRFKEFEKRLTQDFFLEKYNNNNPEVDTYIFGCYLGDEL